MLMLCVVVSLFPTSASAAPETDGTALPERFDLRDRGVVTPVKLQNPWGTCWSFAAISAAETSILSTMGSTYRETGLDLSERHLCWYVDKPVTEDISASQAGEGITVYNQDAGANYIFTLGGKELCAATLFAQGIGPVSEESYPYKGAEGRLAYDDLLTKKETYIEQMMIELKGNSNYSRYSDEEIRELAEKYYASDVQRYSLHDVYSPLDDWSINEADVPGSGKLAGSPYTLTENNVIRYWVTSSSQDDISDRYGKEPLYQHNDISLYQDSIDQVKDELYSGRGVAISINISDNMINSDTWSVYNNYGLDSSAPHAVCIVGWDDSYPADSFTHTTTPGGKLLKNRNGRELSAKEAVAQTTPPGNGAWIVKNSWGSETDLVPDGLVGADGSVKDANAGNWGVVDENGKHTGYFYLSYYDTSISNPESFSFDIRENHDQENALQTDYMPANKVEWVNTNDAPMWEANVFTLDKDMRIDEVATRVTMVDNAPITGFVVNFDLYKLNDSATTPDDGEHLSSCTRVFKNEGYHRTALDKPVYLKKGDRLGIVVQQSHTYDDGSQKYCVSAQETIGYINLHFDPMYGNPVVNTGESFWKAEGITDSDESAVDGWLDLTAPFSKDLLYYTKPELNDNPSIAAFYESVYVGNPIKDFFMMDNFCIKAFGEPCSEPSLLGDVDGDGEVTILDATFIQRYLASFALPFELSEATADADEDGEVSIIDATHIQRWLVSLPCNNSIGKPIT